LKKGTSLVLIIADLTQFAISQHFLAFMNNNKNESVGRKNAVTAEKV
jgi:hypothetical protein